MDIKTKELIVNKIKIQIDEYLEFCDEKNTPFICKLKNEKNGVQKIHNFVLKYVFEEKADVPTGLTVFERILNPLYVTD